MASKTELAKAYVEIVPSAEGISGKISEAMGGEASAAGITAGKSLGSSLVSAATKLIAAAGIGKMLQSAFDIGSGFESSLAKVGTIADPAKASLQALNDEILALSGTMHIGASDLAEATYQAISASVDTADAVSFAGDASKLAVAGFTSSSAAVDILTTAINAYGLTADEAGHISDVLLTTQNKGKTTVDELANTLGRVIPLAAAYNVNLENLAASQAIMTANGIAQAESVTYTKSMLNELGDTGSTVGKILEKETGQSFAQLSADGKTLGDVLGILYDSVGNDATQFAGLWSSVEAGTGALSLANAGAEKFNDVYTGMVESTGATEAAYTQMTDTMQFKMNGLKTSAENLGTALFQNLSEPMGQAVDLLGGYLQTLAESFQSGGFAGLAEGLVSIFTDLTTNVGPQLAQTGMDMLGQLGQGLVNGIPDLLGKALLMVAELASGLRANAGQLVDAGIQFILDMAQGLMDGLPTMIAYLPGIVSDLAGVINDNAPKILSAGVKLIITLGKGLINAVPALVANLPQIIQAIVDVFTAFNWVNLGRNIITLLKNGITAMVGAVQQAGQNIFAAVRDAIAKLPESLLNLGKTAVSDLASGIRALCVDAQYAGVSVFQAVRTVIAQLPGALFTLGSNAMSNLGGAIRSAVGSIGSAASGILNSIVSAMTALPGNLLNLASQAVSGFKNAFISVPWSSIGGNIIRGIISGIGSAIGGLVNAAVNAAQSAFNGAKKALGIHSPSRLFRDCIGSMIPAGMALGIEDNLWQVEDAMQSLTGIATEPVQMQVADVMRSNRSMTAAGWQLQPAVSYSQTNTFYTHDSLSESELTRQAEDMAKRLRWGLP